jgi:hypothetical protein
VHSLDHHPAYLFGCGFVAAIEIDQLRCTRLGAGRNRSTRPLAFSGNFANVRRSAAEVIRCPGIFVPQDRRRSQKPSGAAPRRVIATFCSYRLPWILLATDD